MKRLLLLLYCFSSCVAAVATNGITSYNMPNGYTSAQLRDKNAIAIDNNGNKWVAFKNIGLGKWDGSNWTMYDTLNSSIPSKNVTAIAFDASNNAWIGTINGMAKFDGTSWTLYNTGNSAIAGNYINSIAVSGTDIWIGTRQGTSKYNGSSFTNYTTGNSSLVSDTVQCFAFENGNTWMGTFRGLSKYDGTNWTTYNSTLYPALLSNNVLSLYADGNKIWIGTNGGGMHRLWGSTMENIKDIFPTTAYVYPSIIYSICKGPNGGVCFSKPYASSAIYEITFKPILYYLNVSGNTGPYMAYENSSGKLWLVYKYTFSAPYYNLHSFDKQNYNGFGLGLTYDNFKYLDINNVKAGILNRGDMSWDLNNSAYEVPKGGGAYSIFASALWMGGLDNGGNLHVAAMTYRQSGCDYWPGPLDTITATVDTATANKYDRIWKINRFDVEQFKYYWSIGAVQSGNYVPDDDFLTWPAHGTGNYTRKLAPFVDVDGNGIYNPITGGDYPKIKGDQMLYWIFNDNLSAHTDETGGSTPLKVEVHASAYAYICPSIADSMKALNYTTLYNFKIINRSNTDYDSTYLGAWVDNDLGDYADDFVGCDSANNYGFVYNGDSADGTGGSGTYGLHPPIQSTVVLNGPLAYLNDGVDNDNDGAIDETGEKDLMTCFHYYNADIGPMGHPNSANDRYNYLKALWKDSTHIRYGGNGYMTGYPVDFMYSGLPVDTTKWSEMSTSNFPGDRRYVIGCGPFLFAKDSMVQFDFAYVFSRDTNLTWNTTPYYMNVTKDVNKIRQWFAQDSFPSCLLLNVGVNDVVKDQNALGIYPNPATSEVFISFHPNAKEYRIEIFDLNGKLARGLITDRNLVNVNVSGLSPGLYFVRIVDGNRLHSAKFVKE